MAKYQFYGLLLNLEIVSALGRSKHEDFDQIRGAYHLHRKTGNTGWKIKWYVLFRSERSGKSGRSFEAIHFSRSFRFSRLVLVPFDRIHLGLIVFCTVKTKWRPKIKAKAGEN